MLKLKTIDYEILSELIKNPRLSDRQLGKILRTSQPTITRRRQDMEKEELLEYTSIPNLKKLGFEILAITFGNRAAHPEQAELLSQKAKDFVARQPNLIFASTGNGINSDRVIISFHKDFNDYTKFQQELRQEWSNSMTIVGSFIVSLAIDRIPRNLTFKYLAELIKENALAEKKLRKRKRPQAETKTSINP
jgi:DNA-binding Lrp family transcriptional regulator